MSESFRSELLYALDRLALGFESADPHIRHEAKAVARQALSQIAHECSRSGALEEKQ